MKKHELKPQEEAFLREAFRENSREEEMPLLRESTREYLHAAMRQQHSQDKARRSWKLSALLSYRIPAYQVSVAFGCLLLFVWTMRPPQPEKVIVEREKIVYRIDTARMQAEIAQHVIDTVYKIVEKSNARLLAAARQEIYPVTEKRSPGQVIQEGGNEFVGLENLALVQDQKRGRSLAEDSALTRFTRTVQ